MAVWRISSRVATAALLVLVALDVTLVAKALQSTHTSGIDTSPVSSASGSVDPSATDPATGPVSPSPTTSVNAGSIPLQTMLVALDNQRAWRVGAGSCSAGGASLATTVDGGKTWAKDKASLRRIVRVRPTDDQAAFIIGADSACAAELKDTSNGGGTWSSGGAAGRAWFRDPKDPMVVSGPGPAVSQPCGKRAVLDLAVLTAGSAQVLCADGLVRSTTNNGTVWTNGLDQRGHGRWRCSPGCLDGQSGGDLRRTSGRPGLHGCSDSAGWSAGRDLMYQGVDPEGSRSDRHIADKRRRLACRRQHNDALDRQPRHVESFLRVLLQP